MTTDYVINVQDSDLMQMLYEQDVDLGYNWQQNEPVKQLKEVDNVQKIKNDLLDVNFFIDGETGEQIPIAPSQVSQQQVPALPQYQAPLNANTNGGSNAINLDDCLEILEHSIDDLRPQELSNQTSVVERNIMVRNLNSLIDTSGNASPMQAPNADLWQQIDELAEISGLNLHEIGQPVLQQPQAEMNGNFNFNGQMHSVEPIIINQPFNLNSVNYNGMGPVTGNSPLSQGYPSNFSTNAQSPPIQVPPGYMSPPIISDDGVPMDTAFAPMESPDKQEPKFPLNNFNDFSYNASSLGEGNPVMSSLPEPGQSFFDYRQSENSVAAEFAPTTSDMTSYSTQPNAPFLNPPVESYRPPPLNPSTSSAGFLDEFEQRMSTTVDKNAIMESYESDSGISLDQSPQGLEFLTLSPTDETAYTTDLSIIKTEPNDHDQEFFPELKAIHHNHTYNGTIGSQRLDKKRNEKLSLSRESRDVKKARELNLPFDLEEIILSPVEEYNELLARTSLNPSQQALVKDIRRRGKNKVAAQNCRKRKIETISSMEEDVDVMRTKKQQLVEEQKELEIKYENMKLRYSSLYQQIFSTLRDDSGRPYDSSHFRLEQVEGAVLLVPNMGQGNNMDEEGSTSEADVGFRKIKMEKRH